MKLRVLVRRRGNDRPRQLYYVDQLTGREVTKTATDEDGNPTWDDKEAERAAVRWKDEILKKTASIDWDEAVRRFLTDGCRTLSEGSVGSYEQSLRLFTTLIGTPRDISAVTPISIDDFAARWRSKNAGQSEGTLARHLRAIRRLLRWCERRQIIARAPIVEMPRGSSIPTRKGYSITRKQFDELLALIPKTWHVLFEGLWYSGLRLREALRLHWTEGPVRLDLKGSKTRIHFEVMGHKGRRIERAPVTADFVAFLQKLKKKSGFVLCPPTKNLSSVSQVTRRACAKLSFKATPHDLRRSFATR